MLHWKRREWNRTERNHCWVDCFLTTYATHSLYCVQRPHWPPTFPPSCTAFQCSLNSLLPALPCQVHAPLSAMCVSTLRRQLGACWCQPTACWHWPTTYWSSAKQVVMLSWHYVYNWELVCLLSETQAAWVSSTFRLEGFGTSALWWLAMPFNWQTDNLQSFRPTNSLSCWLHLLVLLFGPPGSLAVWPAIPHTATLHMHQQAGQNERQQKHRAKMVQKEITSSIRDNNRNKKKKQKVSEISVPSLCHCHWWFVSHPNRQLTLSWNPLMTHPQQRLMLPNCCNQTVNSRKMNVQRTSSVDGNKKMNHASQSAQTGRHLSYSHPLILQHGTPSHRTVLLRSSAISTMSTMKFIHAYTHILSNDGSRRTSYQDNHSGWTGYWSTLKQGTSHQPLSRSMAFW